MDRIDKRVKQAADLLNAGDVAGAEIIGRELLAASPQSINVLRLMGAITRKQAKLDESLEYFRKAVELNDRKAILHFELGTAYTELQRSEEAYKCYRKAIELDPTLQPAFVNLSAMMEQHERYDEAITWAEKALALKPDCGLAHYNLANARRELGQLSHAISSYEQALRFKPDRAKTLWNLGICHLLLGKYAEGWRLFEQRQEAQEVFFDRYPQPRWDGSSLAGKTIVVHAEQGIGDEILFASCFPDILPLAKRCIFVCDPRLENLFKRSFPQAVVYSHLRRKDWSPPALPEPFDVQIPAGSLPLYFRSSPESFPRRDKFLDVDPQLLAMWRERLASVGSGLKVGISWRAGGKPLESRKRTIPLDQWADILTMPGVQFVNLQYGDAGAEIAGAKAQFGIAIHDWEEGDPLVDIDSFAAKIAALDLVISVGNATVHIAGAVGTEAWTLLPMVPSWRWMTAGEQSPWYGNVQLFRQAEPDQWQSVLARMVRMLNERCRGGVNTLSKLSAADGPGATGPDSAEPVGSSSSVQRTKSVKENHWYGPAELAGHKTDVLVAGALADARRFEESGDFAQAEAKYRLALQFAPRHYAALNGLGVVARKTGRTELAIRSFRRSLAMIDALPEQQFNLADALADAGRWDEALAAYRRGLKLEPSNAAAHVQAGRMLNRLNRPNEAIEHFQQALAIDPRHDSIFVELGQTLIAACRLDEAIDHLHRAVAALPQSPALIAALGAAYLEDQRYDDAIERFRAAIAISPALMSAHCQLAQALRSLGLAADAAECLERALEADGASFDATIRLAAIRAELREFDKAIALYHRALAICPAEPQVLNSLGMLLRATGAAADALDCFDDAIHFAPDAAEAHVNRAFALLEAGRLEEAWNEYEWRWKCRDAGQSRNCFRQPAWDGSPLMDKTILIHAEQRLDEELFFASCYADVIERAARCVITCDPRLEPLFRRSFPCAHICAVTRGREHQWRIPDGVAVDVQIAAGSLPRLLQTAAAHCSTRSRFLIAQGNSVVAHRMNLAKQGDGLKIGIAISGVKRGRAAVNEQTNRVLKSLARDHSIQIATIGEDSAAAQQFAAGLNLPLLTWPSATPQHDLDEIAARIAALDLVIADGGLPAQLAGTLGVPTCVCRSERTEWHWFGADGRPTWYPSVRLCDAFGADDIDPAVQRICAELLNLAGEKDDESRMRAVPPPHWSLRTAADRTSSS